jgi:hypothetical protein
MRVTLDEMAKRKPPAELTATSSDNFVISILSMSLRSLSTHRDFAVTPRDLSVSVARGGQAGRADGAQRR